MFCENCGNKIPGNSNFCSKCGTSAKSEKVIKIRLWLAKYIYNSPVKNWVVFKWIKNKLGKISKYFNKNKSITIIIAVFILALIFFTYLSIFKLSIPDGNKNVFITYYSAQFSFLKNNLKKVLIFVIIFSLCLFGYFKYFRKKDFSYRKLINLYIAIILSLFIGFNFAFGASYLFALGDIYITKYRIVHNRANVLWDTDKIVEKLKSQKEPPKIIKGENDVNRQVLADILAGKKRSSYYFQKTLPRTMNAYSPQIGISDQSSLVFVGNDLIIKDFSKDAIQAVSPIIGKLFVKKEMDQRFIKDEPSVQLMGRQEYLKFRDDQINGHLSKIDDALTLADNYINADISTITDEKKKVNYYVGLARSAASEGKSTYSSCLNAQDCTYNYVPPVCTYYPYYSCVGGGSYQTCAPRYSQSYCDSLLDSYNSEISQYNGAASNWAAQLATDQQGLKDLSDLRDYIAGYRGIVEASKDDIPQEMGVFEPDNNIKIALDSTKPETLGDYLETLVHEYYHYTSYVSEDRSLPTFFEEGLTEYFARQTIKDEVGVDTNAGYPLITKVISEMMEKIPEKDFQDVYFSKDSASLEALLDNAFGKDYYKNNEVYFEFITFLPTKDALNSTNDMLDAIGLPKISEDDVFSKSSQF